MSSNISSHIGNYSLNLKRILNNPKVNFFIIVNLAIFIGCYNLLSQPVKNGFTTFLSYPIVLFALSALCLFIGYYNMILAVILVVALFVILYPNLEAKIKNTNEGFTNHTYEERKKEREESEAEKERKSYRNKNTFKDIKNNFTTMYEELKDEYEDDLKEGMKENLRNMLSSKRKENMTTKKETFSDDLEAETNIRNRKREQFRKINKRKFNPNDEDDANLLICKEIIRDLLNRITYEYESKEYLKKYVEHRIEEMIDLFKFNAEEED